MVCAGDIESSVWPSGAASATILEPIMPPARLSTTTGCFNDATSPGPIRRVKMSGWPPGVNGTTMRTGRLGKPAAGSPVWADAAVTVTAAQDMTINSVLMLECVLMMFSPPLSALGAKPRMPPSAPSPGKSITRRPAADGAKRSRARTRIRNIIALDVRRENSAPRRCTPPRGAGRSNGRLPGSCRGVSP